MSISHFIDDIFAIFVFGSATSSRSFRFSFGVYGLPPMMLRTRWWCKITWCFDVRGNISKHGYSHHLRTPTVRIATLNRRFPLLPIRLLLRISPFSNYFFLVVWAEMCILVFRRVTGFRPILPTLCFPRTQVIPVIPGVHLLRGAPVLIAGPSAAFSKLRCKLRRCFIRAIGDALIGLFSWSHFADHLDSDIPRPAS